MGYNRSGARRKARLRRRRKEVARFVAKCATANQAAQDKGEKSTEFASDIRHFRRLMKLRG
jgi:hypothetical protein